MMEPNATAAQWTPEQEQRAKAVLGAWLMFGAMGVTSMSMQDAGVGAVARAIAVDAVTMYWDRYRMIYFAFHPGGPVMALAAMEAKVNEEAIDAFLGVIRLGFLPNSEPVS